jgi:cell wall-associated NlpC family hydrolase
MVSQVLLGETLDLKGAPDASQLPPQWAYVQAPDAYEGFVTRGALRLCSQAEAADWAARADLTSLGTGLVALDEASLTPRHAPWGACLASGASGAVELPDGRRANPSDPDGVVADIDRAGRYPPDPTAVVRTAGRWLGTPYVWGGRTEQGADCSGFVQAVLALHGFPLPRDSRDQFEGAYTADSATLLRDGRAGDLWFFAWDGQPVSHVGICLDGARMIHASETRGCVAIDVVGEGDFGRHLSEGLVGVVRTAN